jgi:hypothetical protein
MHRSRQRSSRQVQLCCYLRRAAVPLIVQVDSSTIPVRSLGGCPLLADIVAEVSGIDALSRG